MGLWISKSDDIPERIFINENISDPLYFLILICLSHLKFIFAKIFKITLGDFVRHQINFKIFFVVSIIVFNHEEAFYTVRIYSLLRKEYMSQWEKATS